MWVPSRTKGVDFDARVILITLSMLTLVIVGLGLRPPIWVLVVIAMVLPVYFILEARWMRRARVAFDRDFARLLMSDDPAGLWELIQARRALRWLSPPGYIDEKRGLVYMLQSEWYQADRYLEQAYVASSSKVRARLLPSLIRVKYENGCLDDVEQIGRILVGRTEFEGTTELFLGLALAENPEKRDEAHAFLRMAVESLEGADGDRALAALEALDGLDAEDAKSSPDPDGKIEPEP